jgi:hypothetical protein
LSLLSCCTPELATVVVAESGRVVVATAVVVVGAGVVVVTAEATVVVAEGAAGRYDPAIPT